MGTCLKTEGVDGVEGGPGGHVLAVGIVTEVHTKPAPCGDAHADVPCIGLLAKAMSVGTVSIDVACILGTGREEAFIGNTCRPTLEVVALCSVEERTAPSEDSDVEALKGLELHGGNVVFLLVLVGSVDALAVVDTCLVMQEIVLCLAHLEGITINLYAKVAATTICRTLIQVTAHAGKVLGELGIVARCYIPRVHGVLKGEASFVLTQLYAQRCPLLP